MFFRSRDEFALHSSGSRLDGDKTAGAFLYSEMKLVEGCADDGGIRRVQAVEHSNPDSG